MKESTKDFFKKMDYRIFVFSLLFLTLGFIGGLQVNKGQSGKFPQTHSQKGTSNDGSNNFPKIFQDGEEADRRQKVFQGGEMPSRGNSN